MTLALKGLSDCGAYLTDLVYQGIYDGTEIRPPDVNRVLSRAWDYGLHRIIVVGTSLTTSIEAYKLAKTDRRLMFTVGCQPKACSEIKDEDLYFHYLAKLFEKTRKSVAVGECGLDFREESLACTNKKTQIKYLDWQMQLGKEYKKPLLMCCYNAFDEMCKLLIKFKGKVRGVVHGFLGTPFEAREFIRKGLYIGINGCSIQTKEGLSLVKSLPLNRIILETSSPHCVFQRPHAGMRYIQTKVLSSSRTNSVWEGFITGRSEPANIVQVLEAVAGVRKLELQELLDIVEANVERLFFSGLEKIIV